MPDPSLTQTDPAPESPPLRQQNLTYLLAAALSAFLTGAALIILGLVWLRNFHTLVGHEIYSTNTALIVVLLAFGLGASLAASRPLKKNRHPFHLATRLLGGLAAWALIAPLLFKFLAATIAALPGFGSAASLPEVSALTRTLAALLVFAPPSLLAGALIPTLIPSASRNPQSPTPSLPIRISLILGLTLLGAGTGTALGGLTLLPSLGFAKTSFFAIIPLLGCAILSLGFAFAAKSQQNSTTKTNPTPPTDNKNSQLPRAANTSRCLLLTAAAGAITFFLLTHWLRILPLLLGDNTYTPVIGLSVFFLATGAGAALIGWLPTLDRSGSLAGSLISIAFLVAGVGVITSIYQLGHYPEWIIRQLASETAPTPEKIWSKIVNADFRVAAKTFALPALCLGAIIPLAAAVLHHIQLTDPEKSSAPAATTIARTLLAATIGAAVGALAGGLFSLPRIGLHLGFFLAGSIAIISAIGAVVSLTKNSQLRLAIPLLTIFLFLVWYLFREPWERKDFAFGSWIYNSQQPAFADDRYRETLATSELLLFLEGATENVAALHAHDNTLYYLTNGTLAASSTPLDLITNRLLGHLGMLLHPGTPKRVLNIGLDSGVTAGAISVHPDLEQLHATAVEPATALVTEKFQSVNHNVLANEKFQLAGSDGRASLAATSKMPFDLITVAPVHPTRPIASNYLTADFFRLAKSRLAENGLVCQAVPTGSLDPNDHIALVATFVDTFPNSLAFTTGNDLILVGFRDDLTINLDQTKQRLRHIDVASSLNEVGFTNPAHLWGTLIADFTRQEPGTPDPAHTDNASFIEFNSPKIAFTNTGVANRQLQLKLLAGHGNASSALIDAFSKPEQDEIRNQQGALANTLHARVLLDKNDFNGALESIEKALAMAPRNPIVLQIAGDIFRKAGTTALSRGEQTNATTYFEKAYQVQPHHFQNLRLLTIAYLRSGDHEKAAPLLLQGRERFPESPHFYSLSGSYYLELGELERSLAFHALAVSKAPELDSLWTQYLLAARATGSEDILNKIKQERLEYLE
ncbi:MAG: tetratricopeptide repeat protein [Verrucomicrobiota bacterium]